MRYDRINEKKKLGQSYRQPSWELSLDRMRHYFGVQFEIVALLAIFVAKPSQ
jgi:hypothetical protein